MEFVPEQGVNMEFYRDSVASQYQSEQQGHPVYVEMPFVRIQVPGSQNTIIEVPVDDTHRRRFPVQWKRFSAGDITEQSSGWPLETWPAVNTAQVKTLKYMGVHTVEQLSSLSDQTASAVGPGTVDLRTKAKAAIRVAKDGAAAEQAAMENKRLNDELESLKAMVQTMMVPKDASAEPLEDEPEGDDATPAKRGPGRPKKTDE